MTEKDIRKVYSKCTGFVGALSWKHAMGEDIQGYNRRTSSLDDATAYHYSKKYIVLRRLQSLYFDTCFLMVCASCLRKTSLIWATYTYICCNYQSK